MVRTAIAPGGSYVIRLLKGACASFVPILSCSFRAPAVWPTVVLHTYQGARIWWDPDKNTSHGLTHHQLFSIAHRRNAGNAVQVQDTDLAILSHLRASVKAERPNDISSITEKDLRQTFVSLRPIESLNPDYVRYFVNVAWSHWKNEAFWLELDRHVQSCAAADCKIFIRQAEFNGRMSQWPLPCVVAYLQLACIHVSPDLKLTGNKYQHKVWPAVQAFEIAVEEVSPIFHTELVPYPPAVMLWRWFWGVDHRPALLDNWLPADHGNLERVGVSVLNLACDVTKVVELFKEERHRRDDNRDDDFGPAAEDNPVNATPQKESNPGENVLASSKGFD